MLADRDRLKELELIRFIRDFDNIESQCQNLIYDPHFDRVMERWDYEKTINLMEWKCAICGDDIFVDKTKSDVENFVCIRCREKHNNNSPSVDRRILDSRSKMFAYLENQIYEELEDNLKRGK